jgi:hypothetical protein
MRVPCEVKTKMVTVAGKEAEGVCVTCSRCDETAEARGTTGRSIRFAMVSLRDKCPKAEENFYYEAEDD